MFLGMKKILFVTSIACALAFPAMASSDFQTPVYSGPSANIDSGGMGGTEPMVTRRAPIGPSSSDRGFENRVEDRGAKISREMDRRRDESIERNEKHILKTNE